MNTYLLRLSLLAFLPLTAVRADLDPAIVPAEARWVVSLDLNAVRESTLGKELLDSTKLPQFGPSDETNVRPDPQKILATIGTATAYGTNFSKNHKEIDGVLVLQGTADLRKLAEGYIAQATVTTPDAVQELKDLPFEAYQLKNGVIIGFPKEPIILISQSKTQLAKALEVFRTHKGSITRSASPLSTLLPKSGKNLLVAASVVPSESGLLPGDGPQARILQMANAGSFTLAEDGKTTGAHLTLLGSSDEMADKILKIVQGVAAMVSLAETSDQQLAQFLQSLKVTREGRNVSLRLEYPSDGLIRIVHNFQTKKERAVSTKGANRTSSSSVEREETGKIVAQWKADQDIGDITATAKGLATRTIENVALKNGTLITLTGERDDGENARIDYVEIVPTGGGQPLRFEAESMKLTGYRVENAPFASRGKLIIATNATGSAQFEFPGADATYTLKVRYVDESDGKSTFTVRTQEPEQPAASE